MKKIRKKSNCQPSWLCFALVLICVANVTTIALGIFNAVNTSGLPGTTMTRDSHQTVSNVQQEAMQLLSEAEDVEGNFSTFVSDFDAAMADINTQLLELGGSPVAAEEAETTEPTLAESQSDHNVSTSAGAELSTQLSDTNFVGVPVYENCTTRTRACRVTKLQLSQSSPRYSQCHTPVDSFSEPNTHLSDILCRVDGSGGNQTLGSSLTHKDEGWSCQCYGLIGSSADREDFVDFECALVATLCPTQISVPRL